jgi:hypothetical protein
MLARIIIKVPDQQKRREKQWALIRGDSEFISHKNWGNIP